MKDAAASDRTGSARSRPSWRRRHTMAPWRAGRVFRGLALLALATAALLAPVAQAPAETLRIMAAASLQPVLTRAISRIEETSDLSIVPIYASSGTLARQISQGAPADLYISANTRWADWTVDALDLPARAATDLLLNRLVVIAAPDLPKTPLQAFEPEGILALGDPAHVPAGQYAKQALRALGQWDRLEPAFVFTANVRVALAFAERGEVDAAIVYRSDAASSSRVRIVETLPADAHDPIRYRMIRLSPRGETLAELLQSADIGRLFEEFGFAHLAGS